MLIHNLHRRLFWETTMFHNISIVHLQNKIITWLSTFSVRKFLLEIIAIRSPRTSASSIWWLLNKTVRPCFNLISSSQIARRAYGSTPAVGSSRIIVFASPTNALSKKKEVHIEKFSKKRLFTLQQIVCVSFHRIRLKPLRCVSLLAQYQITY